VRAAVLNEGATNRLLRAYRNAVGESGSG
jgi:hypothetical protein